MQVLAVQSDIAWEDKPTNYQRVRQMLAGVKVQPGALIVLSEMFATGFSMHVEAIAEAPGGPTEQFCSQLAAEHQAFVVGANVTRAADGRGLNESIVFDPRGEQVARYAKLHPFSYGGETKHYAAGEEIVTYRWHDFTAAPVVCYDLRFPEAFRHAARRGAELFTVIASWPVQREAHWLALLRARAIENQAYVIGVNRAGVDPELSYGGRSQVIDPRGEILADAGAGPGVLAADVDRSALLEYRTYFPALDDIRGELLGE